MLHDCRTRCESIQFIAYAWESIRFFSRWRRSELQSHADMRGPLHAIVSFALFWNAAASSGYKGIIIWQMMCIHSISGWIFASLLEFQVFGTAQSHVNACLFAHLQHQPTLVNLFLRRYLLHTLIQIAWNRLTYLHSSFLA
jgi:hypothetical protein